MRSAFAVVFLIVSLGADLCLAKKTRKPEPVPTLDEYLSSVRGRTATGPATASPGSLYTGGGRLADGARDLRASQVFDLVTIVVSDKASALSSGVTNTDRKSKANASIT